jgi:SAM-dependent methyltransferase
VEPKPKGWSTHVGAAFSEPSVAARYHLRPAHPAATIELLAQLAGGGAVLDAGCGPGVLARRLAPLASRVDAVDVSAPMIDAGRRSAGGDAPNLRWILGPVETAPLEPPYSLVVAGESVHWFEWGVALPRFAGALAPGGLLAVVAREWLGRPHLQGRLEPIYARHSANPDFQQLDPVVELERRGLFRPLGRHTSVREPWRPTIDELIGAMHSMSGFAAERMRDPDGFDAEIRAAIGELVELRDGRLELDSAATVVWGRPHS